MRPEDRLSALAEEAALPFVFAAAQPLFEPKIAAVAGYPVLRERCTGGSLVAVVTSATSSMIFDEERSGRQ